MEILILIIGDVFDETDFVEPCVGNPDEVYLEIEPRQPAQVPLPPQPNPHSSHPRGPPEVTTPSKPDRTGVGNRPPPSHNNMPAQRTNIPPPKPQTTKQMPATPTTGPPQPPTHYQNSRPNQPQQSKNSQETPQPGPPTKPADGSNNMTDSGAAVNGNPNPAEGPQFTEVELPEDAKVGFFSARAAEALKSNPMALKTAPQFDPRADSPSIRKTAGINHNASTPVLRKNVVANPTAVTTAVGAKTAQTNSPLSGREASNPPQDFGRRVGAPGGFNSPITRAQTSSYRPPVRRPADNGAGTNNANGKRPPLGDMTNAPATSGTGAPADAKRVKSGDGDQQQTTNNNHRQHQTGVK